MANDSEAVRSDPTASCADCEKLRNRVRLLRGDVKRERAEHRNLRLLTRSQRVAIRHLKNELVAIREALARTGAREELFRIQRILEQSEDRQRRERMDKLVERLSA